MKNRTMKATFSILMGILVLAILPDAIYGQQVSRSYPFRENPVDSLLINIDTTSVLTVDIWSKQPSTPIDPATGTMTVGLTYRFDTTATAKKIPGIAIEYALGRRVELMSQVAGEDTFLTYAGAEWHMALSDTLHKTARYNTTHDTLLTLPFSDRFYFRAILADTNYTGTVQPCSIRVKEITITVP